MEIKANEISALIKQQIKKYQHKLEKNLGQGGRIMTSRQTGRRMGTVAEQHGKKHRQ